MAGVNSLFRVSIKWTLNGFPSANVENKCVEVTWWFYTKTGDDYDDNDDDYGGQGRKILDIKLDIREELWFEFYAHSPPLEQKTRYRVLAFLLANALCLYSHTVSSLSTLETRWNKLPKFYTEVKTMFAI